MIWWGLLLTVSAAVGLGAKASACLEYYDKESGKLPHGDRVELAQRVGWWRRAAHAGAFLALVPLTPAVWALVGALAGRLVAAFGAAGLGTATVLLVKKSVDVPLKKVLAEDVNFRNQTILAALGLAAAGVSALVYVVVEDPAAAKQAVSELLGLS